MRHVLIGFAALVAVSAAGIAPSSAQHWEGHGTWCIQPPIGGGSWTCYYYSEAQCRATAGYGGASCVPNPGPEWVRRGFQIPPELMPQPRRSSR
jgi:Protein of unknown function (DUF3551)